MWFGRSFPRGAVGAGLFLLRVITAVLLGNFGYRLLYGLATNRSTFDLGQLTGIVLATSSLLIAAGFYTTVVAIVAGLVLLGWVIATPPYWDTLTLAPLGLTIVVSLLGPGAYSIDARIFGWKSLEISRNRNG